MDISTYRIKIHRCDVWEGNENMPCFITYIMYTCIIEIQKQKYKSTNGSINNTFTLTDAYPEIYRIKATCFPYHVEVGNWGTCNNRQFFTSQNRQYFHALIPFSEGTSFT